LHTKIQSGEITRRRQETGRGAAITIEAPRPGSILPGPDEPAVLLTPGSRR
jgi:hypothetical protein